MKVEIKEVKGETFKPFELIIKVKTEEDLRSLWHRFNLDSNEEFLAAYNIESGDSDAPNKVRFPSSFLDCDEDYIWDKLDLKARLFGIRK